GVDLEYLGKAEGQRGRDTRISRHGWRDLEIVRGAAGRAEMFDRISPGHPGTRDEIEIALSGGATVLMLPNFESAAEVARFADAVRRRARVVILVERAAAVARIREILDVGGVDEVMLGLNDLHLEFRLANHF